MKFVFTFLSLLFANFLFSQSQELLGLEKELSKLGGLNFVKAAVNLSEEYYREGYYQKAVEKAKKAHSTAAQMGDKEWMAIALNRQSKALIQLPRRKAANRQEAIANFQQSIRLSENNNLKLDNLQQLKQVALMRNKKKELTQIEARIAALEGTLVIAPPLEKEEVKGLFGKRRNAIEKANAIKEENESLNMQLAQMESEKAKLRRNYQYVLNEQKSLIEDMSEEQMRQELALLQQEKLLDSMVISSMFDSINLVQQEREIAFKETELAEQKAQVELKNSQRNFLIAIAAIVLILAIGLFLRYQGMRAHNFVLEEKNNIIKEEKQRSEDLLLNILPVAIADELKEKGTASTRFYDSATVIFTDFKNFSKISKEVSPQHLVKDLDFCFKQFDKIIEKYGLEKIKTIGDAYMCAGGVPKPNNGHVVDAVRAAMEIQAFLLNWKLQKVDANEPFFEARVGVHTGPIIAGVVGSKKFAYDIWGDTVNVASRMESSGEPGKVNISKTTYDLVKDKFDCKYRGKVAAKNVGEIDMYFVEKAVA